MGRWGLRYNFKRQEFEGSTGLRSWVSTSWAVPLVAVIVRSRSCCCPVHLHLQRLLLCTAITLRYCQQRPSERDNPALCWQPAYLAARPEFQIVPVYAASTIFMCASAKHQRQSAFAAHLLPDAQSAALVLVDQS